MGADRKCNGTEKTNIIMIMNKFRDFKITVRNILKCLEKLAKLD